MINRLFKKVICAALTLALAGCILSAPVKAVADPPSVPLSMQAMVADTITARFTAELDAVTASSYESFVLNARLGAAEPEEITAVGGAGGKYYFDLENIYSQCMNDPITCVLTGIKAGGARDELVRISDGVSIASYCGRLHEANPDNAALTAFMARMLGFGAQCQVFAGHMTDEPADAADWVRTASAATSEPETGQVRHPEFIDSSNGVIRSAYLKIKNKVTVCLRVVSDALQDLKVTVSSDSMDRVFDLSQAAADPAVTAEDGGCVITLDEFSPARFDEVITARLYYGDIDQTNLRQTVWYSVNAYCADMKDDPAIGSLARAMYAYGAAAKALGASSSVSDPGPAPQAVLNENIPYQQEYYLQTRPAVRRQTIRAYGVSDCWWSNAIGGGDGIRAIQEMFFTDKGIALNNYRINVGGSVREDRTDGPIGYEPTWRVVYSPLMENGMKDITRNAGGWSALSALRSLEEEGLADIYDYTLFMNSPPSTMTDNGMTCTNNKLKPDCYDAYADYVCDVVELYLGSGLPVRYVSPVNEPTIAAWVTNTGQEACVYTRDEAISVYKKVAAELSRRSLPVKISIGDYSNWDDALTFINRIESTAPELFDYMDHISGHDYGAANLNTRARVLAKAKAHGLEIHQTEWCMAIADRADNMDTALDLARMIYTDINTLDITSWTWWLGVGHGGYADGLLYVSGDSTDFVTTKRFWALGNYSKFTTGLTNVEVGEDSLPEGVHAVAFTDRESGRGRLVYVMYNENAAPRTLTLAGLPAGAVGKVYETSDAHSCEQIGLVRADRGITLDGRSVVTIVFDLIDLDAVDAAAHTASVLPRLAADFEGLSGDLYAQGYITNDYLTDFTLYNRAYATAGKGRGGSTALAYTFIANAGDMYWAQAIKADLAAAGSSVRINDAGMLWLWIDSRQFSSGCKLDLWLNDCKPAVGATLYGYDGISVTTLGTLPEAWGGAGYGRLSIPSGYRGFVGLKTSAFAGEMGERLQSVYLYTETSAYPASLYIDDIWLTAEGAAPPAD